MKKIRIAALLLAVMMALSIVTAASAGGAFTVQNTAEKTVFISENNRLVANGETVSFEMFARPSSLIERGEDRTNIYRDVMYDFAGKLSAKSSVKWITVKNGKYGFTLSFAENETAKARSGKITVTGKGFSATLKIKQYGKDSLISVKRTKNKVTVKLSLAPKSPAHFVSVSEYYTDENGDEYYKTLVYDRAFSKTSFSFKVKAGRRYSVSIGTCIEYGGWITTGSTDSCYFTVETVTGSETIR